MNTVAEIKSTTDKIKKETDSFPLLMNTAIKNDDTRNRQILERIPANRWGTPDDLVGTAIYLASPASDYLHGCTIAVDGGWMGR